MDAVESSFSKIVFTILMGFVKKANDKSQFMRISLWRRKVRRSTDAVMIVGTAKLLEYRTRKLHSKLMPGRIIGSMKQKYCKYLNALSKQTNKNIEKP
jgi:hypothetical protein